MAYVPLSRFIFRAPLLPIAKSTASDLWKHPLGREAIRIASPELAAALTRTKGDTAKGDTQKGDSQKGDAQKRRSPKGEKGDKAERASSASALGRYSRRAAFRATPSGLLAGVGVGQLGRSLRVATGEPRATGRVSWARLQSLARALLTDAEVRRQSRLRLAPSVMVSGDQVLWLGSAGAAGGFVKETRSAIDEVVGAVLKMAGAWTPWAAVRAAVIAAVGDVEPQVEGDAGGPARASGAADEDEAEAEDEDETVAESIDDVLLTMLDDGFLHSDLVPPLIGPRPCAWMQQRLAAMIGAPTSWAVEAVFEGDFAELRARLAAADAELAQGHFETADAILATLPDHAHETGRSEGARAIDAVLRFDAGDHAQVTLPASVVRRACALAPILFRLQEALTPPVRERVPGTAMAEALDAVTEIQGAGALDLRALATGEYGVSAGPERRPRMGGDGDGHTEDDDDEHDDDAAGGAAGMPPPRLLTLLLDAIADAAQTEDAFEVRLSSEQLDRVLPAADAPASCELFLAPRGDGDGDGDPFGRTGQLKNRKDGGNERTAASLEPGRGWLLGLHAPAGSSWGRFAHSLSDAERAQLFDPLVAAEREARPGESCLDVAFAPDAALADLCAHPPFREGALAITHWPAEVTATSGAHGGVVTPAEVALVAEPAAREALALRHGPRPISPSPFHRVRSTTAPPGIWRLLTGWSLCRQHRPWSLLWGPLGDLAFLPRVCLDDFVIAPASWRLPSDLVRDLAAHPGTPAVKQRLSEWRRQRAVPRQVQVGREDELLPVDLDSLDATDELRGHDRVFEIWPPPGDTPDEQGRRLEAVIALVDHPDDAQRGRLESEWARVSAAGAVPPPHLRQPGEDGAGWTTLKLFGLAETQDATLAEIVAPAVAAAREAKEISAWFFQRYIDPPGRRAHLRVRVRGDADRMTAHIEEQLRQNSEGTSARAGRPIVSLERTPYFPESARYGGVASLPAIHRLFEIESDLICACLGRAEPGADAPDEDEAAIDAEAHAILEPGLFHVVRAFEGLARGLGWDASARQKLAARRRHAHAHEIDASIADAWAAAYRRAKPRLRAMLLDEGPRELRTAFAKYERDVGKAARNLDAVAEEKRESLIAALLHVNAVRWLGADPLGEIQAYTFWERTLDSLAHHKPKPAPKP